MSSRSFKARTSYSASNPQLCGLVESSGCCTSVDDVEVDGAIARGQMCFYLTCRGDQAKPERQIQKSNKKDGYSTGFRIVPSGRTRTVGRPPYTREVVVFKWQEQGQVGRWHDVTVWEKMVHEDCARKLGYRAPGDSTTAHKGDRTEGFAHKVSPNPISGLEELAIVAHEEDQNAEEA